MKIMKPTSLRLFRPALAMLAVTIACGLSISPAHANYIVTLQEVGANVVASGSGAIDLTGLGGGSAGGSDSSSLMNPSAGAIFMGPSADVHNYGGFNGPLNFGSGSFTTASSFSGDHIGIIASQNLLNLPFHYVSETVLSNTATYNNATFASIGVTPGTYVWSWGTGADQNFTLKVVTATVPDSGSTFGLLFLSLAALFGVRRFRSLRLA
jgi:hypothetical protein